MKVTKKVAKKVAKRPAAKAVTRPLFRGVEESIWCPWIEGVTQTVAKLFMACMEQCRLQYVVGWEAPSRSVPLMFGSVGHRCIQRAVEEHIRDGGASRSWPDAGDVEGWVGEWEQEWRAQNTMATAKDLESLERTMAMSEVTMTRYFDRWRGDFGLDYPEGNGTVVPHEWLSTERQFCVGRVVGDVVVPRVGSMDAVFRDSTGALWLKESKFKGRLMVDELVDLLPLDFQCMWYLSALREMFGEQPAGVLYEVTRRPQQRWLVDDTLDKYMARVRKAVESKASKDADANFVRLEVRVSREEIDRWERDLMDPLLESLVQWWRGDRPHYANPEALVGKYGKAFMYELMVRGDSTGLSRKSRPFSELFDI